jgi:hypothetical protein
LQQDTWVSEIGQGLTTVSVLVQHPAIKHGIKMQGFLSWLARKGGSLAEILHRDKVRRMLGKNGET